MMFNFEVDSHKNCLKMVNLGYKIGHGKWQDPLKSHAKPSFFGLILVVEWVSKETPI